MKMSSGAYESVCEQRVECATKAPFERRWVYCGNKSCPNYFKLIGGVVFILLFCLINGCSTSISPLSGEVKDGAPNFHVDVSKIPNAVPKVEPYSRYGNPKSYVVFGQRYYVKNSGLNYHERGIASWYGTKFHKQRTSSGEPYNMVAMTAAHKTLPLPTYARVTNLENGRVIIVKINDRGPFKANRVMDLSYAAAIKLGINGRGTGLVQIDTIDPRHSSTQPESNLSQPVISDHNPTLYLQIGAFSNYANATNLVRKVEQLTHHSARLKQTNVNGQMIYRVQVGPLPNVDASDEMNRQLRELHLGNPVTAIE